MLISGSPNICTTSMESHLIERQRKPGCAPSGSIITTKQSVAHIWTGRIALGAADRVRQSGFTYYNLRYNNWGPVIASAIPKSPTSSHAAAVLPAEPVAVQFRPGGNGSPRAEVIRHPKPSSTAIGTAPYVARTTAISPNSTTQIGMVEIRG